MKKEKLGICNIQPKMKKENPGIFIQNKKQKKNGINNVYKCTLAKKI